MRHNGQLRHDDPDLLLNSVASANVQKYREDYSASGVNKAFLPAILPSSGRIPGKFLRLLYIVAYRQTGKTFGEEPRCTTPSTSISTLLAVPKPFPYPPALLHVNFDCKRDRLLVLAFCIIPIGASEVGRRIIKFILGLQGPIITNLEGGRKYMNKSRLRIPTS